MNNPITDNTIKTTHTSEPINFDKVVLNDEFIDDKLYIDNVKSGKIISNMLYPIVYNHLEVASGATYYKSFSFYQLWLDEIVLNKKPPLRVPPQYLASFLIGIRDVFIASENKMLTNEQQQIAISVIKSLDHTDCHIATDFITISPFPTRSHSLLRFMELSDLGELDQYYAVHHKHEYRYIFVDPTELSFHNFDHILDFNTILKLKPTMVDNPDRLTKSIAMREIKIFKISEELNQSLLEINLWDLYPSSSAPSSNSSRGGKRLLFKSDELARLLEVIVKPVAKLNKFHSINNVFRYNNFVPSDNKFTSHFDVPYRAPNLVSRYTLIIYLTSGSNVDKSVLTVDGYKFCHMEKATCVLFHQKYEHEGNPFVDADKIFIRTEIICYDDDKHHSDYKPNLACAAFNSACYFTTQSTKLAELNKHTTNLFNLSTQLHFGLPTKNFCIPILIKKFNNVYFATNGFDYWFGSTIGRVDAFVIILLDFFNGFVKNTKQRTVIIKAEYGITDLSTVYDIITKSEAMDDNSKHLEGYKNSINDDGSNGNRNTHHLEDDDQQDEDDYAIDGPNGDIYDEDPEESDGEANVEDDSIEIEDNGEDEIISKLIESELGDMVDGDWNDIITNKEQAIAPSVILNRVGIYNINSIQQYHRVYIDGLKRDTKKGCCPAIHKTNSHYYNPNHNKEVCGDVENLTFLINRSITLNEICKSSLILMNSEIYINLKDIFDTGSSISFLGTGLQNIINFAASSSDSSSSSDSTPTVSNLDCIKKTTHANTYALPKIDYVIEPLGTRFNICYFRNMFSDHTGETNVDYPIVQNTKLTEYL